MRNITVRLSLFLAAMALAAAGCDKQAPKAGDGASSGGMTSGGKTPGAKYRIVYIPKNTGNPYFDAVVEGFKKGGDELGYEFNMVGPATAEATSQIEVIKQQIQQRVDAIAISPNSTDAVKPALKEAMSKGIKVVCIDSDLEKNEDGRDAGVLPMDFDITGKSQIELMGSLIGYQGEFAILSATTDAPNQNYWIAGMKEALKDPKYKGMKLVEIVYGNDEAQKSTTEAQALLTKHPNLKGILAPTSVGISAAAQVVETAKAASRIKVTGLGTPSQMKGFIENGTVEKFALWSPVDMGYLSGYLIVGLLKGEIKAEPGATFKAGDLGERTIGKLNKIITGPPLVFDKANVGNYTF